MTTTTGNHLPTHNKRSFLDVVADVFAGLQIVASPLIVGIILGFLVYLAVRGTAGVILGSLVVLAGLVVGIIWATKVWRKHGTMSFMSRLLSFPEMRKKGDD